mmetsp:Transcript_23307/g.41219  ORF Transcript_23307/g.41219 Transcript_23307/m.41219 type:complete len:346 (+) Transcript_23307:47-1084(+)
MSDDAAAAASKTENSSYYFFKSTPQELQKQYAPVPLKPGQKLDFTPRVATIHDSALVKKKGEQKSDGANTDAKAKAASAAAAAATLTYAKVRKNAYDFRDKEDDSVTEPEHYEQGQKVKIHGLKKAARYNGEVAEVLGPEVNGRYPVKIQESKKQLNVKRANLKMYIPVVCTEFVDINLEEGFRCTPELLFRALTDQTMIAKYTRSEAKVECKKGGKFSLFGGSLHGTFDAVEASKKIVQKWRFKEWPDDCYSTVSIDIHSPEYGITVATLAQSNVPIHDKYRNRDVPQKVRDGWKNYFWDRIHKVVGFAKVDKSEYRKYMAPKKSDNGGGDDSDSLDEDMPDLE